MKRIFKSKIILDPLSSRIYFKKIREGYTYWKNKEGDYLYQKINNCGELYFENQYGGRIYVTSWNGYGQPRFYEKDLWGIKYETGLFFAKGNTSKYTVLSHPWE